MIRSEENIKKFIKEFEKIWLRNKSLRFGQLIANTHQVYPPSLYYTEDGDMMETLKTTYENMKRNVIIIGAAGRDFHNFNIYFKRNWDYKVVAFTATQIPGIDDKLYPNELSGPLYPYGIPIMPEGNLEDLIEEYDVDLCVFAYSDVTYDHIAGISKKVTALGCELITLSPEQTQIESNLPVISVTATRTGCGKSSVSKKITEQLTKAGHRVGVIRHPMPYDDDLNKQTCQRFATYKDLEICTIEEREEYEPYVEAGLVIWAGVDYEKILRAAEEESDIILWDGGNNDFSFIRPDLSIVVADPLRAGDELKYYPSDINIKDADVIIVNKCNSASEREIDNITCNLIKMRKEECQIIYSDSIVTVDDSEVIKDKAVVVVEDGPTLTHGGMTYGAGMVAVKEHNCFVINPKHFAKGTIKDTYNKYPHVSEVLPAMGYSDEQLKDLQDTINNVNDAEAAIIATPIDLGKLIRIDMPHTRVHYGYKDVGELDDIINKFVDDQDVVNN